MLLRTSTSFNCSICQHAWLSIKPYKKSSKTSNIMWSINKECDTKSFLPESQIHIAKGQKCLSALAVVHHKWIVADPHSFESLSLQPWPDTVAQNFSQQQKILLLFVKAQQDNEKDLSHEYHFATKSLIWTTYLLIFIATFNPIMHF